MIETRTHLDRTRRGVHSRYLMSGCDQHDE
jgi:hypothetical protein